LEFWRARLKSPETNVRTGTKLKQEDRVRFELFTQDDFSTFKRTVNDELLTMKWRAAGDIGDVSRSAISAAT
jgi:hypothetical protein